VPRSAAQSGTRSSLRLLRVLRDEAVIVRAREDAGALVERDPSLEHHPVLAEALERLLDPDRVAFLERG
jgi:ATP-dependent DNA helicase RecG